ncbi:hypothetical protein CVT24_000828 [Panaeolus cyanescens]|uniref:Uncharacterized protein n=1 Tax=Panaeolus cyanescens TaxID=181874 RepID=A0A409YY97_9AGAR|nr:hypothetical protein CVT24_000828 [Panaeolus cyanescens]
MSATDSPPAYYAKALPGFAPPAYSNGLTEENLQEITKLADEHEKKNTGQLAKNFPDTLKTLTSAQSKH